MTAMRRQTPGSEQPDLTTRAMKVFHCCRDVSLHQYEMATEAWTPGRLPNLHSLTLALSIG
jgi:hypothetical protein